MTDNTILFRQVHPTWLQEGRVTTQAFKPTAKDNDQLSVYNGDLITAIRSWEHWTTQLSRKSVGVLAVTVGECQVQALEVESDGIPFPEHAQINFTGLSRSQQDSKAKYLLASALVRDWQYQATTG